MAALRARTKTGPPLYWTPTIGANNLLNADYIATKPELIDDPEAYLGLPQAMVDEIKTGWRDLSRGLHGPTPKRSSSGRSRRCRKRACSSCSAATKAAPVSCRATPPGWTPTCGCACSGMAPMDVLRSMTSGAARVMGVDAEVGTVAAGKQADIIAVGGDPLRYINVLRDPKVVIKAAADPQTPRGTRGNQILPWRGEVSTGSRRSLASYAPGAL